MPHVEHAPRYRATIALALIGCTLSACDAQTTAPATTPTATTTTSKLVEPPSTATTTTPVVVQPPPDATDPSAAWSDVVGAPRFAKPGSPTVILDVRQGGGTGCGGGGCTTGLEIRAPQGAIPKGPFGYYYPDRPPPHPGCYQPSSPGSAFTAWTTVEIAPMAGTEEERAQCGVTSGDFSVMKRWIVLRVRASSGAP